MRPGFLLLRESYNFYSRPCGRGDTGPRPRITWQTSISTHAPAGGATMIGRSCAKCRASFLLTPLREGRPISHTEGEAITLFLLTPLREGRRQFSTSPS